MADIFIRPRQRPLTSFSPHAQNARVIIPSRIRFAGVDPRFEQTHAMSAGRTTPTTGYDTVIGPIGTMDPKEFRGITVVKMSINENTDIFQIILLGLGHGANFWTRIRFESSDGLWNDTEILSADATFTTGADSIWTFDPFTRVFINGIQYRMDWEF